MTTQTKWTPGTWFLNGPWNIYAEREGERSKCVATIVPQGTIAEREANARLIALAPELAEALAAFIDEWHADESNFYRAETAPIKQARALLAKIERD